MRARRPQAPEAPWRIETWRLASLLLAYPDDDLLRSVPAIRRAAAALRPEVAGPLGRFVDHLGGRSQVELAAEFVETFDHRRRCCLYLTYYAYGDTRKRGMALLRFKHAYRAAGLELTDEELPDHLAVVLEFAATGDAHAGRRLLLEHRAGLEVLRLALDDAGSPYVDVLRAVSATLPPLAGHDRDAVARLTAEGPPAEEVGLSPFAPPEYMPEVQGVQR
jgi:nitrate reductase delta subunit